jgi:hypothetical protein
MKKRCEMRRKNSQIDCGENSLWRVVAADTRSQSDLYLDFTGTRFKAKSPVLAGLSCFPAWAQFLQLIYGWFRELPTMYQRPLGLF